MRLVLNVSVFSFLFSVPDCTYQVEKKLSQMVLDRAFSGILDQGKGHLIVFEPTEEDITFTKGSEVLTNVGLVVEALAGRAKGLHKLPVPSAVSIIKPKAAEIAK